ncbi:MAG: peptidase, partial [Pseudomonadota bacterium]
MTYCAALKMNDNLIFMSDTRTNAGVDNISMFPKMFTWSVPGERVITLMTAGNLGTTQAVISLLNERSKAPEDRNPTLLKVPTMFQAARLIADTLREVVDEHADEGQGAEDAFRATIIMGGQIKGIEPRLFLIYPEGNFIEASAETPFFQIGETKYGRPIILRAFDPSMSVEQALRLLCVSFDSTL